MEVISVDTALPETVYVVQLRPAHELRHTTLRRIHEGIRKLLRLIGVPLWGWYEESASGDVRKRDGGRERPPLHSKVDVAVARVARRDEQVALGANHVHGGNAEMW